MQLMMVQLKQPTMTAVHIIYNGLCVCLRLTYDDALSTLTYTAATCTDDKLWYFSIYQSMIPKLISYRQFFQPATTQYSMHGHSMKLYVERCRLQSALPEILIQSPVRRTLDDLPLPQDVVDAHLSTRSRTGWTRCGQMWALKAKPLSSLGLLTKYQVHRVFVLCVSALIR